MSIDVIRDGKKQTFQVVLKNTSGNTAIVKREESALWNTLGAEFETIDAEKATSLELDGGVVVTRLYPGKLRQETQMREGFIITHVNGVKVKTADEFKTQLERLNEGGVMLQGRYPDSEKIYYYAFGLRF